MHDERQDGRRLVPGLHSSQEQPCFRTVTDADEEVFLLYTLSAPVPDRRGLGQVDSRSDLLQVTVHLRNAHEATEVCSVDAIEERAPSQRRARKGKGSVQARGERKGKCDTLEVLIRQDSTSLRSTGGDTGSVIWRSSLYLAAKMLRDLSQAERGERIRANEPVGCLFDPQEVCACRVLELGSGTGILPALLLSHSYLDNPEHGMAWLATDQTNMLPLLRKNLAPFPRAHIEGLDWVEAAGIYNTQSSDSISAFLREMLEPFGVREEGETIEPDVILAADCIFNPSLFTPFVDTLNLLSVPGKTIVVVVCELRESEAMTEFLQTWLQVGKKGERWSIHAMEGEEVVGPDLVRGSVVWVACRVC